MASDSTNYALVYNFFDELAQSTCAAALKSPARVAAIRRDCYKGTAATCTVYCSRLG